MVGDHAHVRLCDPEASLRLTELLVLVVTLERSEPHIPRVRSLPIIGRRSKRSPISRGSSPFANLIVSVPAARVSRFRQDMAALKDVFEKYPEPVFF